MQSETKIPAKQAERPRLDTAIAENLMMLGFEGGGP